MREPICFQRSGFQPCIQISHNCSPLPGIGHATPEFTPWIGHNSPSLESRPESAASDSAVIDLPDYDLRKLMTTRDALCSVQAFRVMCKVVMPTLYGLRMCPECPRCALSDKPCMDVFGSNGTPMGGSAGRADALIGAVEAQKAEGVLHLHFFIYLQMAHQMKNLEDVSCTIFSSQTDW